MSDMTFDQDQLAQVGAKLESVQDAFSPRERALLVALITQGLESAAGEAEVSGFLLPAVKTPTAQAQVGGDGRSIIAVRLGDGSVMPTDQFSLNFTKTQS